MGKREVVAYCYEGLGNRLDTLISAAFIAKRYNIPLSFYWIENQISNDANTEDLFETIRAKKLDESGFLQFVDSNASRIFTMSRNISRIGEKLQLSSCESFGCNVSLVHLDEVDKEIILVQTCTLAPWAATSAGIQAFYHFFVPKRELYKAPLAQIGLHIRGTDMLEERHVKGSSVEHAIEFAKKVSAKHPGEQIFVCSDDAVIENALKALPNSPFIMFEKEHVTKRDPKASYNDGLDQKGLGIDYQTLQTFEHQGRQYKNVIQTNLVRSKDQIVGGMVDLLSLSQVKHLYGYQTSQMSTFFLLATLLNKLRVDPFAAKKIARLL